MVSLEPTGKRGSLNIPDLPRLPFLNTQEFHQQPR
jgi:hypothetical protein